MKVRSTNPGLMSAAAAQINQSLVVDAVREARRSCLLSRAGGRLDDRIVELHALGLSQRAISQVLAFYEGATVSRQHVRTVLAKQGLAQ